MATTVEKKIIILSGISDKSTATAILNHTPYGVSVQLSAKMLCLHIDKLTLIVRCGSVRELVDVGNSNKVCLKVLLKHDIADWDNIHCIIANNVNGNLTPLLYGTNAQKVLWQGNMLDGIIVEKNFDNVEQDMILPMQSSQEEVVVTYSQNNLQDSIDSKLAQSKEQMHSKVVEVDLDTQNSNIEQTIIQPKQLIDSLEQVPILPQFDEVFNSRMSGQVMPQNFDAMQSSSIDNFQSHFNNGENSNSVYSPFDNVLDNKPYNDVAIASVNYYNSENDTLVKDKFVQKDLSPKHSSSPVYNKRIQQQPLKTVSQSLKVPNSRPNVNGIDFANLPNKYKSSNNGANGIINSKVRPIPSPIVQRNTNAKYLAQQSPKIAQQSFVNQSKTFGNSFDYHANILNNDEYKEIPTAQKDTSKVAYQPIHSTTFWEQVQEQVEKLFEEYPTESNLTKLLPDTKWAKVDFDNNGKYFVVGIIGKEKPQFVCYGVPATYTPQPPKELDGYCQWIPTTDDPTGKGYWLMYQDATTGESVRG